MTPFKTTLLAAMATLGLASAAAAADPYGWYAARPGESIENQGLDLNRVHNSIQVERFFNPRTGRNNIAVIQRGRNNSAGVSQRGVRNNARIIQRGNNTNVRVNQNGNNNISNVLIFGTR